MTSDERMKMEQGQLALALVMEDFQRRVEREEASEEELSALMSAALDRFPPEFQSKLRAELAARSA
jgi:hypothetical protein